MFKKDCICLLYGEKPGKGFSKENSKRVMQ